MSMPPEEMQKPMATQPVDPRLLSMMQEEIEREKPDPEIEATRELVKASETVNLAERMSKQERDKIALDLLELIDSDEISREDWSDKNQDYLKLAVQVMEQKSFPWNGASNVKYPLLTTAAMQFQSRCYKALIPGTNIVKARVVGNDFLSLKRARANRISEHMNYQLLEQIPNWEEHQDTLCLVVPICGNAFKKTYYDGDTIRSELVLPQDMIVNYYSTSIEDARRKTHVIPYSMNDIISAIRSGYFLSSLDVDLLRQTKTSDPLEKEDAYNEGQGLTPPADTSDKDTPIVCYECHCWLDLDEDGYEEPYIVSILKDSMEVVRITPRFSAKDITLNASGEIVRIKPVELFTNYRFVPDPRSGVYGLGFGHILGPINEATNTLINQIIDSGTLGIMPSGWLARGARMQTGVQPFKPGEWKILNTMGDDLRKSIIPLPIKEPSPVLFQLLNLFIEAGNQLASVTDLNQGKSPGQNQPFSTTSAVMEQGMAVYSTIFKRMHRALKRELQKIYRLNTLYLEPDVYFNIVDSQTGQEVSKQVSRSDYEKDTTDVVPSSDPEQITNYQKLADAELLMQLLPTGLVNPQEGVRRILIARGITDLDPLLELPPPQPNPEMEIKAREVQIKEMQAQATAQIEAAKAQSQATRDQAASVEKLTQVKLAEMQMQLDAQQTMFENRIAAMELEIKMKELELKEREIEVKRIQAEKPTPKPK